MSIKILHIVPDDKFIDYAIDTFNQTSSINTYMSIDAVESFTYIKSHAAEVQILSKETLLPFILNSGYHLVAFHTLPRDKYELALQIPKHIKVLWLSWGYDLYSPVEKMPATCRPRNARAQLFCRNPRRFFSPNFPHPLDFFRKM